MPGETQTAVVIEDVALYRSEVSPFRILASPLQFFNHESFRKKEVVK